MGMAARKRKVKFQYKAVPGSRVSDADARVVGPELERIGRANGDLTPEELASSPLHKFFEWSDRRAAQKYRLEQARHLIRSVQIKIVGERTPVEVRAFVKVERATANGYMPTVKAFSRADYRAQVLTRALEELNVWQQRYAALQELAGVFTEIDKLKRKLA